MIDCPYYYVFAGETTEPDPPVDDVINCAGCNCGYLQYEGILAYLREINDQIRGDVVKGTELEFKLREQIVEVSRLFDVDAGVSPGYFSKAHYKTTQIFRTDGTQYLKIPPHVEGTLELRSTDDVVIDPATYGFQNGHLVYLPCYRHTACGCPNTCGTKKRRRAIAWPNACYKVTARWGVECADMAVQKAVRDYLIETYRMDDPIKVLATGIPIQRTFRVPHSWETYIRNFKAKRRIFSGYAIA